MMEWMCEMFDINIELNDSINSSPQTIQNHSNGSLMDVNLTHDYSDYHLTEEESVSYELIMSSVVIPAVCAFGLLGNLMALVVLLYRAQEGVEMLEKGSLVSMIALAITDFMFCFTTIIIIYLSEDNLVYQEKEIGMYVTVYGPYFQNVIIKVSTYITVLMTLYRHAAVSRPVSAKQYLTVCNTLCAIVVCSAFWFLFILPFLWTWSIEVVDCNNNTGLYHVYGLMPGPFQENANFKVIFVHSWSIIGFIIPVIILGYCNVQLIMSVRTSLSRTSSASTSQNARQRQRIAAQRKMNITLITIVASFFLLIFPSELFHYHLEFSRESQSQEFTANAVITCNLLQAVNMSINFLLYCVVNSNFRQTLKTLMPHCALRRQSKQPSKEQYRALSDAGNHLKPTQITEMTSVNGKGASEAV